MTRKGDWIQTFTGKRFYPLDPKPEEVDILDIAHSLAMKCRYAGHTRRFYSVAEHSYQISCYLPARDRLWGLLHDAAEAYSADIPTPLKRHLKEWHAIEAPIMEAICVRFGLPLQEPDTVKIADRRILVNESQRLMTHVPESLKDIPPLPPARRMGWLPARRMGWLPAYAERKFLTRFDELYIGGDRK